MVEQSLQYFHILLGLSLEEEVPPPLRHRITPVTMGLDHTQDEWDNLGTRTKDFISIEVNDESPLSHVNRSFIDPPYHTLLQII